MAQKYSKSPLARIRKTLGYTQDEAATLVGLKNKNTLCAIETGERQASGDVLEKLAAAYGVSKRKILQASTDTFEAGRSMRRHRARQAKLVLAKK